MMGDRERGTEVGRRWSRRDFIGASLASAAVLAACGGSDDAASGTTTTSRPTTRTVTHDYGTVEVPQDPQRVVAMENRRDVETAVVLGLALVAVGKYGGGTDAVAPFVPIGDATFEVFDNNQVNLEAIIAMQPDLILSREIFLGADDFPGGGLTEAGPVLPIASEGSWRSDLEQVAGWLGREATLGSALDQYDAKLSEVGARHGARLGAAKVAIVEFYAADSTFYAGGLDGFQLQANTLAELDGSLIDFVAERDYFDEPFSMENVGELAAADAILLVTSSEDEHATLTATELWQRLPAVAAGRVVRTDTRTNQGSVYAATECLDLLDRLYATLA